jgi:hypothetical protein
MLQVVELQTIKALNSQTQFRGGGHLFHPEQRSLARADGTAVVGEYVVVFLENLFI